MYYGYARTVCSGFSLCHTHHLRIFMFYVRWQALVSRNTRHLLQAVIMLSNTTHPYVDTGDTNIRNVHVKCVIILGLYRYVIYTTIRMVYPNYIPHNSIQFHPMATYKHS